MSFMGKVVLVTGAGSGIGASTATLYAAEGATLALIDRNGDSLKQIAKECRKINNNVLEIVADLTLDEEVKKVIAKTIEQYKKLNVLVNNAGRGSFINELKKSHLMQDYDVVMATNLRAMIYLTQLAAPYLIESKGCIVNISSMMGKLVTRGYPYAMSKAGVNHFTQALAGELGEKGVRINAILPGFVRTNIPSRFDDDEKKKRCALGRISEPNEVANMILFLSSDKAKSVTGSLFEADNGYYVQRKK